MSSGGYLGLGCHQHMVYSPGPSWVTQGWHQDHLGARGSLPPPAESMILLWPPWAWLLFTFSLSDLEDRGLCQSFQYDTLSWAQLPDNGSQGQAAAADQRQVMMGVMGENWESAGWVGVRASVHWSWAEWKRPELKSFFFTPGARPMQISGKEEVFCPEVLQTWLSALCL